MTELFARLTTHGDGLFAWLLPALLWTGALFVIVRAVDELLSRRVSASWRVALYAVVLLRLALPAGWETPFGVLPGPEPIAPLTTSAEVTIAPIASVPVIPPTATAEHVPHVAWTAALPVAYGLGVALLLAWMLTSRRRLHRELAGARPAREEVASLAPSQRVVEHDAVGPAVAGVLRPRIVVPSALIELLDRSALAAVLRHESAHVERRDPWLQAGVQLTLALLWPVLPLWLAAHRVRQLVEQACDERALAGRQGEERVAYGEALIAVAAAGPSPVRPALGLLRFGAALRSRIRALRHGARWPRLVQFALVAFGALALFLAAGTRPIAEAVGRTEAQPQGRVAYVADGPIPGVFVKEAGSAEWRPGLEAETLLDGSRVRFDQAGAELLLSDGQRLSTPTGRSVVQLTGTMAVLQRSQPDDSPAELHRLLYEPPLEVQLPGRTTGEGLEGMLVAPVGALLRVEKPGKLAYAKSSGDLRVIRGPMQVLLEAEALLVPGVPEGQPVFGMSQRRLVFRQGEDGTPSLAMDLHPMAHTALARLPADVAGAFRDAWRRALRSAGAPEDDVSVELADYQGGLLQVSGRARNKLRYSQLLRALEDSTHFEDIATGIIQEDAEGVRFRLEATWAPSNSPEASAIARVDRLATDNQVRIDKISISRRAPDGTYSVAVQGRTDGHRQLWDFERDLRDAFPGASLMVRQLESGDDETVFQARLSFHEDGRPAQSSRESELSPRQVLIEFRIVELAPEAELPEWSGLQGATPPYTDVSSGPFNTFATDLWIQSQESKGLARIISAPRIMVQVGEQAEIESGVQIPIVETTASGVEVARVKASLKAEVRPQRVGEDVISQWTVDVADPAAHLEGSVSEGLTGMALVQTADPDKRIAVWITPQLQEPR